jgi:hypothetical protein
VKNGKNTRNIAQVVAGRMEQTQDELKFCRFLRLLLVRFARLVQLGARRCFDAISRDSTAIFWWQS